jgi:hypothetical protein
MRRCVLQQLMTSEAKELNTIINELPSEKVQALMDFAYYLRQQYVSLPRRGLAASIFETMTEVGPLQFAEGELDSLLVDIEAMRQLDITHYD